MINYTYKYRIYPNNKQKILIEKSFGCCRFVYNYFLSQSKNTKYISYNNNSKLLTNLKKDNLWLCEISAQSLQYSLINLDQSYQRYFKKLSKYPKFKKKNNKQSFNIPQRIKINKDKVFIPKFQKGIKIKLHRKLEGKICNATISKNKINQYYISICVQRKIEKLIKSQNKIGLDLGIKNLVVDSNSNSYKNIKFQNIEKRRRLFAKSYSRKKKGSKSKEKARIKLAKYDLKISNIRKNYLHKTTSKIINENQVIVIEDLNVKDMMKNKRFSKGLQHASFHELTRQLIYKSKWYGREIIQINRWFSSSKTCNNCKNINKNLKLNNRNWICQNCNTELDRDINAAKNILEEGLRYKTVGITGLANCLDVRPNLLGN